MTRLPKPYKFAKGKSTTVLHDLDEFVTERMARCITGRYAQGRPERFRSGEILRRSWSRKVIRPKSRPWLCCVKPWEYCGPWLCFLVPVGEWSP